VICVFSRELDFYNKEIYLSVAALSAEFFSLLLLTLTPPINASMHQNWPLGADSGGVKVKRFRLDFSLKQCNLMSNLYKISCNRRHKA